MVDELVAEALEVVILRQGSFLAKGVD